MKKKEEIVYRKRDNPLKQKFLSIYKFINN